MNINQMLKQAQAMQKKIQDMQEELSNKEYVGKSGGGLVELSLNGEGKLLKINIDPNVLKADEKEILEDLIVAAHIDAKTKIEEDTKNTMGGALGGLNLPAGFKMPF